MDLQPLGGLQPVGGAKEETPAPAPTTTSTPVPLATTASGGTASAPYSRPATYSPPARYEEEEKPSRVPLYIGLGVVVAAAIGVGTLFLPSAPVDTPVGFATFSAADKSFGCDLPEKWHVKAEGSASTEKMNSVEDGVTAKKSDAQVHVTVSSIAGLGGAQLVFGDGPVPTSTFGSRSEPIFKMHGKAFKKQFKNYKESAVTPTIAMYPKMTGIVLDENGKEELPDIKWTEFTADSNSWGLGGKRHGYRMAVGGSEYIVNVVCECSERDWQKLKPAFERTIASVKEIAPKKIKGVNVPGGGTLPTGGGVPGLGMPGMGPRGL